MLHGRSRHTVHKTVVKKKPKARKSLHARSRHQSPLPGIAHQDAWRRKGEAQGQG